MKKYLYLTFPMVFALLTLGVFLFLYRPAPASPEATSACLVFFTALGWSALIVFSRRERHGLKTAYAATALLASILLILAFRPFPVEPLPHLLMVAFQVMGMAGILLYLHTLNKKGGRLHR